MKTLMYFLSAFIALVVVGLMLHCLAELSFNAKEGIYQYVCQRNGGCK